MIDEEENSVYMSGHLTDGTKLATQQAMHSQYVLQLLQLQRRAGFLCDITINIQEKSFKAHKPLLAACSLYFRALFAKYEHAKSSTLTVEMLSAKGFEVLLDYIYSGSLAITSENSDQVLHAANCLQMTNVVETCLNFERSSFKVTTGAGVNPRRPDTFDLSMALHGSGTPQNTHVANQPQSQTNSLHIAFPPDIASSNHNLTVPLSVPSTEATIDIISPQVKSTAVEVSGNAQAAMSEATPAMSPTSETLTTIIPYLVAKNARRPTLNEVRQLLSSTKGVLPDEIEASTKESMKSLPPQLIPVAQPGSYSESPKHPRASGNQIQNDDQVKMGNATRYPGVKGLQDQRCDSNTASHATVNTGRPVYTVSPSEASGGLQPFVTIPLRNGDAESNAEDNGEGRAWSDDRSVNNSRSTDRDYTHLSGTPCSAGLTVDTTPRHRHPSGSPASFGSTPSIEISPVSESAAESSGNEFNFPLKLRWARAQSLDFSKAAGASRDTRTKGQEDARPSSLSPKFFRNCETSSPDAQASPKRPGKSGSRTGAQSNEALEEQVPNTALEQGTSSDDYDGPLSKQPYLERENTQSNTGNVSSSRLLIKQEVSYSPTSPPTADPFMDHDDVASGSTTPSVSTSASHEGLLDENGVLDLSMQKPSHKPTDGQQARTTQVSAVNDTSTDPKAREALDALVMMQASVASHMQSHKFASPPTDEGSSLTAGFSRKPRRSSGGQTCNWPGCGRLFRHRNIFEEHLKLHQNGIPVKQLRKCYMGARVKKTARERLDEMRSVEGASSASHSQQDDGEVAQHGYQRASHKRKRASSQAKESTDRKRVTAKDRKDHLARNNSWHQTQASIQHTPMYSHHRQVGARMAAVPMAVANSVYRPQTSWPIGVPATDSSGRLGLLNYVANSRPQGVPALAPRRDVVASLHAGNEHSTTVVEAMAALGIPIPSVKRDSPHRACIPAAALTSPNSGVALDQLRRSMALMEKGDGSLAPPVDKRIGNVPGTKFSPNGKSVQAHDPAISDHSARPGPNPYHSPAVVQRVAKI